ncbi:hypothetical protein [Kordiimonas sp. SCSIO 12610]|uniref:hypothetical protein n=1 Tax=Kordiimonas sp. SCSIO 12610 TaxID=2829597 RepID=UPI00210E0352|nr:hypothetical protein [Kordiimonas sp. SCSIO 12610]UTW55575.1 hypothetical protein KFF44_01385 [Kordiimonas sp. SCSIO 12610]
MSITQKTHYEILVKQVRTWAILEVRNTREVALNDAEEIWKNGQYIGIRVIKESFDQESKQFSSVEIFSRGINRKESKYDKTGQIAPCLSPNDLYSIDGRKSIWDLLNNTLTLWQITPTELLHNLEHYYKLYNEGNKLQDAVQRTAVTFEDEENSIQSRMQKLYKVIELAVTVMKQAQDDIPSLDAGKLNPLVQSLSERANRTFLLLSAITNYIKPTLTLSDKFGRIAVLLSPSRPYWVMEALDQLLSEFLLHPGLIVQMLGTKNEDDRGPFLSQLVYLQSGNLNLVDTPNHSAKFSDDVLRINSFISEKKLPATRHVLLERLKHEITEPKPINNNGLNAQIEKLKTLQDLLVSFETEDHILEDIEDIINTRMGRLINSQTIGEILYEIECPFEQINTLLDIEEHTLGASNKRTLANFILPILSRPDYETIFMGLNENPLHCMPKLADLQARILKTEFSEMHRRKISEELDKFCRTIMDSTQILKKVHQLNIKIQDKAMKLLTMLAENYFTEGDCREQAEKQVRLYMKQTGFTEGLIIDLPAAERPIALLDFRALLERAGINRVDDI